MQPGLCTRSLFSFRPSNLHCFLSRYGLGTISGRATSDVALVPCSPSVRPIFIVFSLGSWNYLKNRRKVARCERKLKERKKEIIPVVSLLFFPDYYYYFLQWSHSINELHMPNTAEIRFACGHLDFESAVTAQNDEFKGRFCCAASEAAVHIYTGKISIRLTASVWN